MAIRVGDRVTLLDDDLGGVVRRIAGNRVTVEIEGGFEQTFLADELVPDDDTLKQAIRVPDTVIQTKEHPKRPSRNKRPSKRKQNPPMEVDLHIHQLLESTRGMTKHDILTYQLQVAEDKIAFARRNKISRIVFIHGKGDGVLKLELEFLLKRFPVDYYDADYQKYGFGATEVRVYQN